MQSPDTADRPDIVDLFAGPGGWDFAVAFMLYHGIIEPVDLLGVEWDDAACATRKAAFLRTLQADVAKLDPHDYAGIIGLIASPPCQAWSMAGSRKGELDKQLVYDVAADLVQGRDRRAEAVEECEDPRSMLVVEPLRWALALKPQWVAFEQVPPVLELWERFAVYLREAGYSVWTGIVSAEQYGVPQTRKRAILIGRRDGTAATAPTPTHQRYIPAPKEDPDAFTMFELPARERIVHPDDHDLLPWVSMAEALGWGMTSRPYPVIASGRTTGGPDREKVGGSAARQTIYDERDAGRWQMVANNQANASVRGIDEPAPTIKGGHDYNDRRWIVDTGNTRGGSRAEGRARPTDTPAPVVTSRADQMEWRDDEPDASPRSGLLVEYRRGGERIGEATSCDAPAPTITSRTDRWQVKPDGEAIDPASISYRNGTHDHAAVRPATEPAPTLHFGGRLNTVEWVHDRPATTVAGDPRIAQPGHKKDDANPDSPGRMEGAVRVTEEEAAVLQSFPADYPWQGNKGKRFEQIGNAVPPQLAAAILLPLLDRPK